MDGRWVRILEPIGIRYEQSQSRKICEEMAEDLRKELWDDHAINITRKIIKKYNITLSYDLIRSDIFTAKFTQMDQYTVKLLVEPDFDRPKHMNLFSHRLDEYHLFRILKIMGNIVLHTSCEDEDKEIYFDDCGYPTNVNQNKRYLWESMWFASSFLMPEKEVIEHMKTFNEDGRFVCDTLNKFHLYNKTSFQARLVYLKFDGKHTKLFNSSSYSYD